MSTTYQMQSGDSTYIVVDDTTTTYVAVVTGAVTDQVLGGGIGAGLAVETSRRDLGSRITPQGLFAVTGYPAVAFPKLASTGYSLTLALSAPGFVGQTLAVTIPQNAVFPVSAPSVALRRVPVKIQGRVVDSHTGDPLSGALVSSVVNPLPPPANAPTVLLRIPLYYAQPTGTNVQPVTLANVGSGNQLTQSIPAGSSVLPLSSLGGLTPGTLVQLANQSASASGTLLEYGVVTQLIPASAGQPAQAVLANPLNRSYSTGTLTTVNFFNASPTGSAMALTADAEAGDGLLQVASWVNGTTVMIGAANTSTVEYHELGALTDADGFYAVGGVGGVPGFFPQASHQGSMSTAAQWFIEFDQPNNVVNFQI